MQCRSQIGILAMIWQDSALGTPLADHDIELIADPDCEVREDLGFFSYTYSISVQFFKIFDEHVPQTLLVFASCLVQKQ